MTSLMPAVEQVGAEQSAAVQVALESQVHAGGELGLQVGVAGDVGAGRVLLPSAGSYSRVMVGRPMRVAVAGARQLRVRLRRTWSRVFGSGFHSRCTSGVQTLLRLTGRLPRPSSPCVVMPSQRRPACTAQFG